MQIDRARADGAAAGQGDLRLAITRQQRAEHEDGGAHGPDQFVRRKEIMQPGIPDLNAHALIDCDFRAHAPQQFDGGGYIVQVRHIADGHAFPGQQGRGQDRQGGVFRPRDGDLAGQRQAAVDNEFIHIRTC